MNSHPDKGPSLEDVKGARRFFEQLKKAAELELAVDAMPQKNGNRNKPCHCGSGRKFKKCCWRGL